jgi:hypothetical protein
MAKRPFQQFLPFIAVGLVAVSLAGRAACKAPGAGVPAAQAVSGSPDDQLSAKLALYIDCVNELDPLVVDSREHYTRQLGENLQIDPARPPLILPIQRTDACFEKLATARKQEPKLADVEAAAAGYEAALRKLAPLLVDADRYYTQNNYKDDAFAKGNALHPQILAAYKGFFEARAPLHDAIDKYNKEILAHSLERIEKKEGKSIRYYTRRVMNDASGLIDLAMDPGADPTKLRDAISAYTGVYGEMVALADKSPAEKAKVKFFFTFADKGQNLVRDLKEMQRSVTAQLDKDKSKPVEISRDSRQAVLKSYNEMVEASNELEFL